MTLVRIIFDHFSSRGESDQRVAVGIPEMGSTDYGITPFRQGFPVLCQFTYGFRRVKGNGRERREGWFARDALDFVGLTK